MTETYGVSVQVHVRQIVAPIGAGEARIPALVRLPDERLFLFYDERPAPASGTGADFNGLTMASDLPNPNQIRWMERTRAASGQIRILCRRGHLRCPRTPVSASMGTG